MATRADRRQLNKHWLRKWLSGKPHFIIGGEDNPYLLRWFVIPRNAFLNIYLHKFLRSDDDRALHDHPWYFASLILKGNYWEHRADKSKRYRRTGTLAIRRADTGHRVELETNWEQFWNGPRKYQLGNIPVWTLFITGPKIREWGFFCPKGWVHWETFDHNNGCGEYA